MKTIALVSALLFLGAASAQESFKCPHEYGFYPHARSCDKYWKCENDKAELKTCGNGLAFDAGDSKFLAENCDYLHNVDCGDRVDLEPPQPTKNCPRLYGIFHDEERCDTFWSCWNGEASRYTCAPGLAYDSEARVCMWADQVPGCKLSVKDGGFQCPDPKNNPNPGTFSRHAHPEDCRKYYVCLDGNPREYGCPIGTVFKIGSDEYSGQCEDPEGVDGCENYYGDELKNFKKSELYGSDNGSYKTATNKPTLRKKIPQVKKETASAPKEVQAQPTVQSHRVQQQQVTRVNPRPSQVQQVEQQPQQQQQQRPNRPQLSQRVAPATTRAPATTQPPTTQAPAKPLDNKQTPQAQDDEYYYYDENYDVPANNANANTKKQ